ncbi:ferredoxin--NADP reductase [bacterium]|nr:MAG: ferredoxin--NADP reductase [bacterium]
MLYYTLKVVKIRQETPDTVTIIFLQPGLKKVKYQAGQYLTLIFRINNRKYIRPYSFSSAPGIDSTLNVTVKRVPDGIVSNHIADYLKVDDVVEVMEPMGNFTLENKGIEFNNHIIFWGAGSGITPLISLIKYTLYHQLAAQVTLVYGNRNYESAVFNEQITELQKKYSSTFSVWHFHTQAVVEDNNPNLVQGRINSEKVLSVLKQEGNLQNTFHYICGPAGLKESVKTLLEQEGINQKQIFTEEFQQITNSKDLENITTRTVSLINHEQEYEVEVVKGKTILEAGLDNLIDLSYSCQTGNCLVCKAKLLTGELKLIGDSGFQQNLEPDEYLLCCSFPLTDNIRISIA